MNTVFKMVLHIFRFSIDGVGVRIYMSWFILALNYVFVNMAASLWFSFSKMINLDRNS